MALYLGNQKVTPSITNTIIRTITQDQQGNTISDVTDTTYTTQEDPDNQTSDLPTVTEWTRPSGWPNLDNLPVLTEGVYLTFDNRNTVDYKWAGLMCRTNTGSYRVYIGHVNNNSWIQDNFSDNTSYKDLSSGSYLEASYSHINSQFIVFKVVPASTNHITEFYFARIAAATLGTYALRPQQNNRCLERVGKLPYLTTTNGSGRGDNHAYSCGWLERDKVSFGDAVTSLVCAWYRAYRLQKVEFDGWTGENCNITGLSYLFEQCTEIEKIDLSSWKTHNWHVNTLQEAFYICLRLKQLNIPWDTTNWGNPSSNRTITLQSMCGYCESLESLDLSSWDTSGWRVTSLQFTWGYCYRLKSLNVKTWKTSNWRPTNLQQTWDQCYYLVDIDLSGWDTTDWTMNGSMAYAFRSNLKRRDFNDIKYWKTGNWRVTSMLSTFDSCYSVHEMDLTGWDVSEWPCTDLSATWSNCRAMRSLKVGTWDMTKANKWKVTSLYAIFNNCYSLEDTTFFNWTPSNWTITRAGSAFYGCFKLKEIDLTNWNAATWNMVDGTSHVNYMFAYCHSARKIDVTPINFTNITLNNYGSNGTSYTSFYECYNLEILNLPNTYKGHICLSLSYNMSHDELMRILNALPTPLSGAKLVLSGMRYKLTNAEITALQTKGYTIS